MKRICLALLLALLLTALFPISSLGATTVRVGLLWTVAGEDYLGFQVAQGVYSLEADGKIIRARVTADASYRVGNGPWGMVLFENGNPVQFASKLVLTPMQGNLPVFTLQTVHGSKKYRGSLEITCQTGKLSVVNTLGEQEYLYGVVPVEMSNAWAAQGAEALKAQAVAARTYLKTHYDAKLAKGYNITDSPNIDQAYSGYGAEGAASRAVDATAGEVLVDKVTGKPINTSYHSNSGGHTEDSENVWGGVDPHLRGKPDPYSANQGFIADHWQFVASGTAIGKALGIGPVVELKVEKFPSGRVKTVIAKDVEGKTVSKSGSRFAGLFYPRSGGISVNDFLGSLFSVEVLKGGSDKLELPRLDQILLKWIDKLPGPRLDRFNTSSTPPEPVPNPYPVFRFSGSGWGHGVGMSQWGAYGMAKQGFTYRQILNFYYTGIDIAKNG